MERDLDRIAVVNQTTLLRNETLKIIEYFKGVMIQKYGSNEAENIYGRREKEIHSAMRLRLIRTPYIKH